MTFFYLRHTYYWGGAQLRRWSQSLRLAEGNWKWEKMDLSGSGCAAMNMELPRRQTDWKDDVLSAGGATV